MLEANIFTELSLVFIIVAIVAGIMRYLKQPLILGYILTGVLVGPVFLDLIKSKEAFEGFSEIGISLLLFIIGLGMNITTIRNLGKVSVTAAAAILVSVGGVGYLVCLALGLDPTTALIVGLALFFSSTIIILKALSDKKELNRLHGQVAIGVIIVDDIVATLAMIFVTTLAQGDSLTGTDLAWMALKAFGLGLLLFVAGAKIMPHVAKKFASSQEFLFLFTIAWGFGISTLFYAAGFSHEVGALFAGVALASLPYATEMSSRLKPLRDFFIVLFFVTLGETFAFGELSQILLPAIILSIIVIIGKPLFVMISLGILGYTKLTSFKAGVHLSQISEFSIVLIVLAVGLNLIDEKATSLITLVALITIAVSSYLMKYDTLLYKKLQGILSIFERKNIKEKPQKKTLYTCLLFGYHHGGYEFLKLFRETKERYLVVDYNPEVIEHMEAQGIRHAYGDATDEEFLEEINAGHAEFAASTILDTTVNKQILGYLRRHNPDISFVCHAGTYEEALDLYKHGASYVILPRVLGSDHLSRQIKKHGFKKEAFAEFRNKHIVTIGKHAVKH